MVRIFAVLIVLLDCTVISGLDQGLAPCTLTSYDQGTVKNGVHPYMYMTNIQNNEELYRLYLLNIQNLYHIKCILPSSMETFNFTRLSNWISADNTKRKFLVSITCYGPRLSMTYPAYTPGVLGIIVNFCTIINYWKPYSSDITQKIQSELLIYQLYYVTIHEGRNMPRTVYTCDPPSLRHQYIYVRNDDMFGDTYRISRKRHECPSSSRMESLLLIGTGQGYWYKKLLDFAEQKRLERLKLLHLSHRHYTEVPLNLLKMFKNQQDLVVSLHKNMIKRITKDLLVQIIHKDIPVLDLRENNIYCDCVTSKAADYMKAKPIFGGPRFRGLYDIKCKSPPMLEDKLMRNVSLDCPSLMLTLLAIILPSSAIIIILIGLFIKFRSIIHVLVYTRWGVTIFANVDSHSKKYDAFIAYNKLNERWVSRILVPRLERNTPPFKLCIHGRDFPVGASIAETIINTVEVSRHTVMILSKQFIQSEWCLMEFRTAYYQSIKERSNHLISVLMDDITEDDISKMEGDLKMHLRTRTYLNVRDRWFWDKLIYSLSTTPPLHASVEVDESAIPLTNITI